MYTHVGSSILQGIAVWRGIHRLKVLKLLNLSRFGSLGMIYIVDISLDFYCFLFPLLYGKENLLGPINFISLGKTHPFEMHSFTSP